MSFAVILKIIRSLVPALADMVIARQQGASDTEIQAMWDKNVALLEAQDAEWQALKARDSG